MKRLMLAVAFVVSFTGCFPGRVIIPDTPEGSACYRQCQVVGNTCRAGAYICAHQVHDCAMSCPGATEG